MEYKELKENEMLISEQVQENPFSVSFSAKGKTVKITLKNVEDTPKIGVLLSKWLTRNGIENTIEYKDVLLLL